MVALHRRGKLSRIGLDFGASGMRMVQLRKVGDTWHLHKWSRQENPLNEHVLEAKEVEKLAGFPSDPQDVQFCFSRGEFDRRHIITALSPPDIDIVALEIPEAVFEQPEDDVNQAVRFEVARLLGESKIQEVETRHWVVPKPTANAHRAIGVAASVDRVHNLLALCRQSGLDCICIDAAAVALCRFGSLLHRWSDNTVWGILDFGLRQVRLILCIGQTPVLARVVCVGGIRWTQRIAEGLGITQKTAEVHKLEYGIARGNRSSTKQEPRGTRHETKPPVGTTDPQKETNPPETKGPPMEMNSRIETGPPAGTNAQEPLRAGSCNRGDVSEREMAAVLLRLLRPSLNELTSEIKRSYDYVLSCYPSCNTGDLLMVGGGAALTNLPEFLNRLLGIPVNMPGAYTRNHDARLRVNDLTAGESASLALAIGLAVEE